MCVQDYVNKCFEEDCVWVKCVMVSFSSRNCSLVYNVHKLEIVRKQDSQLWQGWPRGKIDSFLSHNRKINIFPVMTIQLPFF